MFTRPQGGLAAVVAVLAACAMPGISHSEILTYTFPVCGAPNSYEPGWVPNGDPMVNGEMTLTIDAEQGLLSLKPSQELLDSIRYGDYILDRTADNPYIHCTESDKGLRDGAERSGQGT